MRFSLIVGFSIVMAASLCRASDCDDKVCRYIPKKDQEWAKDLASQASKTVLDDLREKFDEVERLDDKQVTKRDGILRIFVSWSMPEALLKSYVTQGRKYGGVLVFKGLPNESFKVLSQKILDLIGKDEETASMQIDDEAFEKFRIESVPVITLSKTSDEEFDKITGNIGIKYALEEFSKSGALRLEAKTLLEQAQ